MGAGAEGGGPVEFQIRVSVSESLHESVTQERESEGTEWVHFLGRGKSEHQVPKAGKERI